ncbi:tetratricopeptide repeat protein [Verrucomicrobia bacterium]|nr:tetratricopeptide repeat protein [Verrucomicrobiota bacterium]MDC0219850.1 tetratricopeptide repeat protein [Verrucomicrobiota bacterium]
MKIMFRNQFMVFAGSLVFAACAGPGAKKESANPTAGRPVIASTTSEVKPDPEAERIAEDAAIERRIRSMAHYAAATAAMERGQRAEALEEFEQAALADPTNEKIVLEVVRMLLAQKKSDKVLALLVKATINPKAPAKLHALLAVAYSQKGKLDLARIAAESAIRKAPGSILGYKTLVQVYEKEIKGGAKRLPQIRKVLDEAFTQEKPPIAFQVELALMAAAYIALDNTAAKELQPRIRKLLDAAWASKPTIPLMIEQIGRGYRMIEAREEAAAATEALLKALPGNPAVLMQLAQDLILAGKLKEGRIHLEAILKKNPGAWRAHQLLAAVAMDEDEYAAAAKHYREAIKLNPRIEQLYFDLVSALLSDEKPDEARKVLDLAKRKFKPNFLQAYFAAMISLEKRDFGQALDDLRRAETIAKNADPTRLNHILYFQMGTTAERAGKFKEAEKYFRQSIEKKPDYATALNYLGYMWADRGENLDEAIKLIDRALKESPDNGAYLDSRAWALFKQGKTEEALKWQLKALKQTEEGDAEIFLHLSEMYLKLKQLKAAREYIDKAAAIKDMEPDVKARIQAVLKQLP